VQLYAITDRRLFASPEALIQQAALWAKGGVDFIQIREKDLPRSELAPLSAAIVSAVRSIAGHTRVLLNGPAEIASEAGCDGVHLTADLPPSAIETAKAVMARFPDPVVSVSCHTPSDIERARAHAATLAIFAPVFEKRSDAETVAGQGLDALSAACHLAVSMPLFALGGVTAENADECIRAGATGIAAIRLFASGDWRTLRK
jgi:thiamine-phosphate pyrophosphorylase